MINKKGQIAMSQLGAVILTFLIIVVMASVGAEVITGTKDSIKDTITVSVSNQTLTAVLITNVSVTGSDKPDSNTLASTFVASHTTGNLVQDTDYRISSNGNFQLLNTSINNSAVNVSFDQQQSQQDVAFNTTGNGETGIQNISGKFGLLGTVIILAVIIGVVIFAFAFAGGRV